MTEGEYVPSEAEVEAALAEHNSWLYEDSSYLEELEAMKHALQAAAKVRAEQEVG